MESVFPVVPSSDLSPVFLSIRLGH